jgi:hypothetical protein
VKRQNWLRALNLTSIVDSARVCEDHFLYTDYIRDYSSNDAEYFKRKRLKPCAIPKMVIPIEELGGK